MQGGLTFCLVLLIVEGGWNWLQNQQPGNFLEGFVAGAKVGPRRGPTKPARIGRTRGATARLVCPRSTQQQSGRSKVATGQLSNTALQRDSKRQSRAKTA